MATPPKNSQVAQENKVAEEARDIIKAELRGLSAEDQDRARIREQLRREDEEQQARAKLREEEKARQDAYNSMSPAERLAWVKAQKAQEAEREIEEMKRHRWVFTMKYKTTVDELTVTFKKDQECPLSKFSWDEIRALIRRDLIMINNSPVEKIMNMGAFDPNTTAPPAWQQAQAPAAPVVQRVRG